MVRFVSRASFFLMLLLLVGCEGGTRLSGKILDQNGQPIDSASVMLDVDTSYTEFSHRETLSKSDGSYYLELHHPPGATRWITVSKAGYKIVHQKLHGAIDVRLDVVLKPEKALKQP
jgi:carboxypeptidase family protein